MTADTALERLRADLADAIMERGQKCASGTVLAFDRRNLEDVIQGVLVRTPRGLTELEPGLYSAPSTSVLVRTVPQAEERSQSNAEWWEPRKRFHALCMRCGVATRDADAFRDLLDGMFALVQEARTVPQAPEMVCEQHPDFAWPHDDCSGPRCVLAARDEVRFKTSDDLLNFLRSEAIDRHEV